MDPSQEPLLTVNALFCKARPPHARQPAPHHSHSSASASVSSSASASASSSSQPPGRAHSQARVVTFVGQIVHVLTNTRSDQKTIAVPQDPLRYPLQRHALRLYQKKCPDLPLDLVIWLAPLGDQTDSTLKASRTNSVREANNGTAEQRNRDLSTTDSLVKKEDDASTALSWSDSDRSQFSQTDSNSDDDDDDDDEALLQQPFPDTMVAVLLSRTFDQDKDKGKDNNVHWRSLQKRLKSGSVVTVRKAVMLFDETNGKKVVSCVGIPDRTTFKVSSRPRNSSKSKRSRTSTTSKSDSQRNSTAAQASGIGSKKRKPSVDSSSSGQQEGGGSLISAKRMRTCTGNKVKVIASTGRVEDSNALKQETATSSEKVFSVREPLIPASTPAPNSLQLLMRRAQEHTFSSTNPGGEKITYFSTLVSNVSYRSVNSGRSHTTPDGRSRTSSSSSVSSSNNTEDITTTRHICWLRDVRCATLAAVCAECGNSYRNLSCVFGCRSRTWRLGIRVECIVRDGTGQACVVVTDDQEDIMWTLLGLNIKTGSISSDSTDAHANARNTVLAIVARRGELSYRTDSPDSPALSSLSLASSGGHVETINHDRSERAQFEERLWLDICSRCPSVERTLLLDAVAKQGSCGTASPGTSADRPGKLKTSLVRLGPETTILTLIPPPLVLCAVDIKRIQPKTEARMLLSQLCG